MLLGWKHHKPVSPILQDILTIDFVCWASVMQYPCPTKLTKVPCLKSAYMSTLLSTVLFGRLCKKDLVRSEIKFPAPLLNLRPMRALWIKRRIVCKHEHIELNSKFHSYTDQVVVGIQRQIIDKFFLWGPNQRDGGITVAPHAVCDAIKTQDFALVKVPEPTITKLFHKVKVANRVGIFCHPHSHRTLACELHRQLHLVKEP